MIRIKLLGYINCLSVTYVLIHGNTITEDKGVSKSV